MSARIDDQALAELIRQLGQRNDEGVAQLLAVLDELRERRADSSLEVELRTRQAVLMRLTRSDALGSGDIAVALREITEIAAETLGVARSSVWRYNDDHSAIVCQELYRSDAQVHEAGIQLAKADFPSYFEAIRNNRIIAAHDAHTHPATREFSEPYLAPLGITSMLDAPIRVGGRMIGVVCNEHVGEPRRWTTSDEQFGAALGDVIALAFESAERKRNADELRAMVELAEQRLETIERQRLAIANLSAPIIDIWEGILVLPVVGLVDTQRSMGLTERLLNRIVDANAESVIVDLTGVDVVDTMTANHILQMLRAASLLGAFSVLSGISPQIAQTLVQFDVGLTEITTVRNLEQALKTCLRRSTRAGHPTPDGSRTSPSSRATSIRRA